MIHILSFPVTHRARRTVTVPAVDVSRRYAFERKSDTTVVPIMTHTVVSRLRAPGPVVWTHWRLRGTSPAVAGPARPAGGQAPPPRGLASRPPDRNASFSAGQCATTHLPTRHRILRVHRKPSPPTDRRRRHPDASSSTRIQVARGAFFSGLHHARIALAFWAETVMCVGRQSQCSRIAHPSYCGMTCLRPPLIHAHVRMRPPPFCAHQTPRPRRWAGGQTGSAQRRGNEAGKSSQALCQVASLELLAAGVERCGAPLAVMRLTCCALIPCCGLECH